MMAARGNAANKIKQSAEEKRAEKEIRKKSEAITDEDIAELMARENNKPKDKWRDPELSKNPISKGWLTLSAKIRDFAYGEKFGSFVLICICVAGIVVGIQTYPGMDQPPSNGGSAIVWYLDMFILYVFTLEITLKIFSEGWAFWSFWLGSEWKWNNFDLFIVVACYLPPGVLPGGSSVALLRLLRLARLVKLFKKIPQVSPHMHTRTQAHKHTSTQAHKHTSTQAHKHTSTQAHKHTSTQAHKHTSTQAHKHTSTLAH